MIMSTVTALRRQPPEWSLGDRLRKVRRELGMSQDDFAVIVGVSHASLGAYELGTRTPPHRELIKIAARIERATGYPAEWIVMGIGAHGGDPDPLVERPQMESNHLPTAYKSHGSRRATLRIAA